VAAGTRPQLCVSAVVVDGGRLLLVQRGGSGAGAGRWAVPGGRVEPGERVRDAVTRELHEETGVRGRCGDLVGWVERVDDRAHYVILSFRVAPDDEAPAVAAGDDARDAAWVPLAEVAGHDLVDGLAEFLAGNGVIPSPDP
jgi:8-oxo-dGTP diphosphatase